MANGNYNYVSTYKLVSETLSEFLVSSFCRKSFNYDQVPISSICDNCLLISRNVLLMVDNFIDHL